MSRLAVSRRMCRIIISCRETISRAPTVACRNRKPNKEKLKKSRPWFAYMQDIRKDIGCVTYQEMKRILATKINDVRSSHNEVAVCWLVRGRAREETRRERETETGQRQ